MTCFKKAIYNCAWSVVERRGLAFNGPRLLNTALCNTFCYSKERGVVLIIVMLLTRSLLRTIIQSMR